MREFMCKERHLNLQRPHKQWMKEKNRFRRIKHDKAPARLQQEDIFKYFNRTHLSHKTSHHIPRLFMAKDQWWNIWHGKCPHSNHLKGAFIDESLTSATSSSKFAEKTYQRNYEAAVIQQNGLIFREVYVLHHHITKWSAM